MDSRLSGFGGFGGPGSGVWGKERVRERRKERPGIFRGRLCPALAAFLLAAGFLLFPAAARAADAGGPFGQERLRSEPRERLKDLSRVLSDPARSRDEKKERLQEAKGRVLSLGREMSRSLSRLEKSLRASGYPSQALARHREFEKKCRRKLRKLAGDLEKSASEGSLEAARQSLEKTLAAREGRRWWIEAQRSRPGDLSHRAGEPRRVLPRQSPGEFLPKRASPGAKSPGAAKTLEYGGPPGPRTFGKPPRCASLPLFERRPASSGTIP